MKIIHVYNSKFAAFIKHHIVLYPFVFFAGVPTRDVIAHEMCHVDQIEKTGVIRFYVSYLLYYFAERLRGRLAVEAYMNIPYEEEARAAQYLVKMKMVAEHKAAVLKLSEGNEHMEYK